MHNKDIPGGLFMSTKISRILRLKKVLDRTGDSRSGLYKKIAEDIFPKPIKLSTRSVGWLEDEVDAWIEERIEATRGSKRDKK